MLLHQRQHWLAVADLHFGYEISQRVAGNLFPFWGMQTELPDHTCLLAVGGREGVAAGRR